jgi:hypothetical protein
LAAFQLAIAPQAGQACLSRAATSVIGGRGRGGAGSARGPARLGSCRLLGEERVERGLGDAERAADLLGL